MCDKLGMDAPWFIRGGAAFSAFCTEHGVDETKYLQEVFKTKGTEKWKYLQDTFKEKKRGTVTTVDANGKCVKRRANCTGEQKLDDIDWPFYSEMEQAMLRRPSVCPPPCMVLQTRHVAAQSAHRAPVLMGGQNEEDGPTILEDSLDETPIKVDKDPLRNNKRSARNDEASSPIRLQYTPHTNGKRPSSADRKHSEVLAAMAEHSSSTNDSFSKVVNSITTFQKQLQTSEVEAQLLDKALKIQTNWDERYMFLLAQKISPEVIKSQIGSKPTASEAIHEVLALQEILRKTCQ